MKPSFYTFTLFTSFFTLYVQFYIAQCTIPVRIRFPIRTGIGNRISRKRLEIEVRFQWDTNKK